MLEDLKKDHSVVITLEDGILDGGFGEKIARFYGDSNMKVLNFGLKKRVPGSIRCDRSIKRQPSYKRADCGRCCKDSCIRVVRTKFLSKGMILKSQKMHWKTSDISCG